MTDTPTRGYTPPSLRKQRGLSRNLSRLSSQANTQKTSIQIPNSVADQERRRQKFATDATKNNDEYGLISRGEDNRLQRDPEARRTFFKKIQEDFSEMFAGDEVETLRSMVSNLGLNKRHGEDERFDNILMSLRKLREALLKFPIDEFAKSVFLFSIRVSTRVGHYQTYIPSITHLLKTPEALSKEELNEVTNFYCLHLSHFNNDDQLALEALVRYGKGDVRLRQVLESWRTQDYKTWFDLYHSEREYSRRKLMSFGERKMILYAINCIEKSYKQLPKSYVWDLFQVDLNVLTADYACNWVLKDEKTVLMKLKV